MSFRLFLALPFIVIVTFPVVAQEIHSSHCLYGCPSGAPASNDLIIREIYILSSNDLTKFADWAAYRVTKKTIGPTQTRTWKPDPLLAENETLEPDDYKEANATLKTDRGHQVPLASFTGTPNWKATNYLSNITPQKSDLNQGAWVRLESAVRNLAKKPTVEAAYVMTGPLYEKVMPAMPRADEPHMVPSGYWKVVAVKDGNRIKVAAFVFDQDTPRGADYCDQVTTVDAVEQRNGLNFFHGLDRASESQLERSPATLAVDLGC